MSKDKTEGQAPTDKTVQATECKTVTVEEAAELLGIGRSLAYELARSGELPGVIKLGHRYVVSRTALFRALGVEAAVA